MVETDVAKYKNLGAVMLMGDFNARTASEDDFIMNDDDNYLPLHEDYIIDSNIVHRKICISSRLRILNGRTFGDL